MNRLLLALPALFVVLPVGAEDPNIEPGLWEYENVTTFEGEAAMPEQRETDQECVTQEDLDEGIVFDDLGDECELLEEEITSSSIHYSMLCADPQGSQMEVDFRMDLMGDRTEGIMTGEMETPMGKMEMRMESSGQRIGDC